jgi:hypothetical protein
MTVTASAQSSGAPFFIDYNDVDDPEPRRGAARPRTPQRGVIPRTPQPGARPRT